MESLENSQSSSKGKHKVAKNKLDKILQLPEKESVSSSNERRHKKSKFEDGEPRNSAGFSSQEYLDKASILQQLRKEEMLLKTAIVYEKLRKEQPVLLNTDILHEKIAECQRILQQARNEQKMKNVLCVNLQLANTLQRIVGKTKGTNIENSFSDTQRKCIEDLLRKKKEMNRRIGAKRKEIADIDQDILNLEQSAITNKHKRRKLVSDCSSTHASTKADNLEEIERLNENNVKVAERVHLLSGIIQSLVPHTGSRWQNDPKLLDLMAECEKVSKCEIDDLDDINELLTSVKSVSL